MTAKKIDLITPMGEALKNDKSFSLINKANPCEIQHGEHKLWIYIKQISSAHFENRDVTRAQLPQSDIFQKIKESDDDFIFLGYDMENDVYATWNPHIIKQRLNEAKYVSLYSRMNAQVMAKKENGFVSFTLNNNLEVCVFPREMLCDYLLSREQRFVDKSVYVARGSKRRKKANEAYRIVKDANNIKPFAQYLNKHHCLYTSEYCQAIKLLINNRAFITHCNDFLAYDSLKDYSKAIESFVGHDDVRNILSHSDLDIAHVLYSYIDFLTQYKHISHKAKKTEKEEYDSETHKINYISDDNVIKHIEQYLNKDIPTPLPAMQYLINHYTEIYPDNKMELKDWSDLIHSIEWNK